MNDQLWNVFRETGEPMGYLLFKAEHAKQQPKAKQSQKPQKRKENPHPSL